MLLTHSGVCGVLFCLAAGPAVLCLQNPAPILPVTRLSGDAAPQTPPPQTPPQPPPLRVPGLPVTQLDDRTRSADLDAPQRLTLSFSEPANVKDVLLLLVRGTPLSIAIDPEIRGTFVGELKDVTLRQAIDSVLAPNGLAFETDGNVIRVFPRRTETRLYDLNFLNLDRTWQRTLKPDDQTVLTSRVPAGDALDELAAGLRALLSDAGRVHVDRRAGLAHVTDYPDRLDRIGSYVEALHLRGSRQVRLQVRVLEVSLRNAPAIDWRAVWMHLGLPEKSITAGVVVDATAFQSALASQGDVEVVATQELLAVNNEPAVVHAATPGRSALTLTLTPQISADGIVLLSVSPSWLTGSGSPTRSREETVMALSEADTVVRVMDGSTVMVSGFLHSSDRASPATGLAGLLGAEQHHRATKETVVLLTPTVVTAGAAVPAAR